MKERIVPAVPPWQGPCVQIVRMYSVCVCVCVCVYVTKISGLGLG